MTYRNLSPEALELEFNPRAVARNLDERLAASAAASAETRARLDCVLDVRYGPGENETLDIFPAASAGSDRGAPVQLFIHGGYWRAMDKSDYSFIADVFQPAGATTVVINYDLCPAVTLDTIVEQSNRSIAWTWRNIADYGGDPECLYVSGNSAGGHLTAMALAHDWEAEGLPADLIKGGGPDHGGVRLRAGARHHGQRGSASGAGGGASPEPPPPSAAAGAPSPHRGGRGGAAAVDQDVGGLRGPVPRARHRVRLHGDAGPGPTSTSAARSATRRAPSPAPCCA